MSTVARPRRRGGRGGRGDRWARVGLAPRLFAAVGLVVLAGAVTLLVVALLVAPPVFRDHLRMGLGDAGPGTIGPAATEHVDRAFTDALLIALVLAVLVATLAALAVAMLVSRRIAAPVADLAAAAGQLAAGDYRARAAAPGLGPEFAALADGFNGMAERLAATERVRQRLLADLSHELRTPIASIEATVEAVADGVLPAQASTWATLGEQTARLDRLVADLAAVSQAEERTLNPHPVPLSPAESAAEAVAAARARYAAARVGLELVCAPATPRVRADRQRLTEALANLLDNALRHTPPGGTVTVTTGHDRPLGRDLATITVADTGEGFEPDQAARIFERFYRTDTARTRHGGGSGIGLAITRAIVAAHQGTIRAHSDGPGRGATITIGLPADPAH